LRLGRVFVANMTGNVVFSGFALVGAPGFSLSASLAALAGFLVGALGGGWLTGRLGRDGIAALLALAMGVQNAVARRLAVPDLTTTVLTMTLTGIAADVRAKDHGLAGLRRRILAVAAMFGGAVAGALLVLHAGTAPALGLAAGLLAGRYRGGHARCPEARPVASGVTIRAAPAGVRAKSQARSVLNVRDLR
jgi:uncharacterized membrane protein YoaK (UPF0700 family)